MAAAGGSLTMAARDFSHVPASTYRLQLSPALRLDEAATLAPYLARLGITMLYTSPILAARSGSTHGYDTCDHGRVNPELGGDEGLAALATALGASGIELMVDFVPNHMSFDPVANRWWRDVLENGPSSEFARTFDIDWTPVKATLANKVLLPVLGDQYGAALEDGRLQIVNAEGVFSLRCFDLDLPLNPRELRRLLGYRLDRLEAVVGPAAPGLTELQSIIFQMDHMPAYTEASAEMVAERSREKEVAKQRLSRLLAEHPAIREHIDENVRQFNGTPGDSGSFDLLHELLERQAYRLAFWRTATHEINYRRFFDVNELVGIRVEEPSVFAAVHARMAELVAQGLIQGLRLDHVDGLFDPAGYLERLSALLAPHAPYVVVEKILSRQEPLAAEWTIHGTTGYEFMNDVNGIFVQADHAHEFRKLYGRFTGDPHDEADVVYDSKKLVMATSLASELNVLAHWLDRISEQRRRDRDFTLDSLKDALGEIVACFPVYRTYVGYRGWTERDERAIDAAVAGALMRSPAAESSIFAFVRRMMLPAREPGLSEAEHRQRRRFAMKLQQYTGPVQAKGVEDTAFYRCAPLLSVNEVGGDLARVGRQVEEFHRANADRLRDWPASMTATSTHDAKRGEDARARLSVLSEMPAEWRAAVSRWSRATAKARTIVNGEAAPDRRDEYLFYQALLGAWPAGLNGEPDEDFVGRIRAYMQKAVKEAKIHTSWINPSADYDSAVSTFVERTLRGPSARAFLRQFLPFAGRIARLGAVNALAQLVLKIASPGVPDFYQGTELWDLSFVDPDNRRPVDFAERDRLLSQAIEWLDMTAPEARTATLADLLTHWHDGRIKLYLTAAGLRLRRDHRELFLHGDYVPLPASGDRASHVVAFARRHAARAVIAIAPRLVTGLFGAQAPLPPAAEAWLDLTIALPDPLHALDYRHAFTGERVVLDTTGGTATLRTADVLRHVPTALLIGTAKETSA